MSMHSDDETLLLRDPRIELTDEVLKEVLGVRYGAYAQLVEGLKKLDIIPLWQYYRDGTSWMGKGPYVWTGPRGGQREYNTLWMSVWDGFLRITVYFRETERHEVLALDLSDETRKLIDEGKKMGKMNTFPICFRIYGDTLPPDVLTLIEFKKSKR